MGSLRLGMSECRDILLKLDWLRPISRTTQPMDKGATNGDPQQVIFVHKGCPRPMISGVVFRMEKRECAL